MKKYLRIALFACSCFFCLQKFKFWFYFDKIDFFVLILLFWDNYFNLLKAVGVLKVRARFDCDFLTVCVFFLGV